MNHKHKETLFRAIIAYLAFIVTYTVLRIPAGLLIIALFTPRGPWEIGHAMRYLDPVAYFPFWQVLPMLKGLESHPAYSYVVIAYIIIGILVLLILATLGVFRRVRAFLHALFGSRD